MESQTYLFDDQSNPVFLPIKAIAALSSSTYSIPTKINQSAWFDIRVFYVRVSSCSLEDAPDVLTMHYLPKSSDTSIEVNGGRICQNVCHFLTFKRDRMDRESAEVTYVSTDNLRTSSDLFFKVFDRDDQLICGSLEKNRYTPLHPSNHNIASTQSKVDSLQEGNSPHGWKMACTCTLGSSKCSFIRKRPMFSAITRPPPCVEVYLAGRVSGLPVVLTETIKLIPKRKYLRREIMDTIAEGESEISTESLTVDNLIQGSERREALLYTGLSDGRAVEWDESECSPDYEERDSFCASHEYDYLEVEDGQLSWFKAGVRVGVGIGLGICLGLGIGFGVLVRTYQSTTRTFSNRTFRRKFL